jgi:hypothetical protein
MGCIKGQQHKTSLVSRLEQFFIENPDEELTIHDIAAKFGVATTSVHSRLWEHKLKHPDCMVERVAVIRLTDKAKQKLTGKR